MESKKAAFMGKITAGVTHEIKNVLAIIKESAGLMEDLITLSKDKPIPQQEKFIRSLSRIADQVARGVDLSSHLNAFAHAPDETLTSVELNSVVKQAVFLCQRFARLQGLTLHARPSDGPLMVTTDPLGLQMLLFECVALVMSTVESGAAVTLEATDADGKSISIESAGKPDAGERPGGDNPNGLPGWPMALETARELGVTVEGTGQPPAIVIRFAGRT